MGYRDDATYKELERIIRAAGIKIEYKEIPDDTIDGEIWARGDGQDTIEMPEADSFSSDEQACLTLGHEMGHFLSDLDSPDFPVEKRVCNEAICDLIGVVLYKLAEMTAGHKIEQEIFGNE